MNALLVAAARMVPLALVAPLGPPSVRLLVGAALALVVAGAGVPSALATLDGGALAVLLVREVAVGVALGLAATVLVLAAELAGALFDGLRGSAVARHGDAQGLQLFGRLLALALFAALGGPLLMADAVGRSYVALPMMGVTQTPSVGAVIGLGARLLGITVELAAPVLVATLIADLALGLVRRGSPSLARGVGAPGGAAARELMVLGAVLLCSGALVGALSSSALGVGEAVAAAARALGAGT